MPWPEKIRHRVSGPAASINVADLSINGSINGRHCIAQPMAIGKIVVRMRRVQEFPEVMPGTMSFWKPGGENIPRLSPHQVTVQLAPDLHAFEHASAQTSQSFGVRIQLVTNQQLYFAIGIPMLFNAGLPALVVTLFSARFAAVEKRFDQIDKRFDDLRDLWRAELRRVEEVLDARLKHLEERG
jgi:hypothetical protein